VSQRSRVEVEKSLIHSKEGTKKPPCSVGADYCRNLMQVFPCFHCGGSLTPHNKNINEHEKYESVLRRVYRLAQALKKHPAGCYFGTELCVRSCSVSPL